MRHELDALLAWQVEINPQAANTRTSLRGLLHKQIHTHFNDDELKQMCFDLEVDYGDVRGNGKSETITKLLLYVFRTGQERKLLHLLKEARPSVNWPDPSTLF